MLAYTFSRPLNTLKNAFREAGKGRLGVRISNSHTPGKKRSDEIGELLSGFDHMAEEIETRIEQQKALLHDVSHELRSPLARLNLAVGLARQNPAQLDTSLSRIETEAERLDNLIGQLIRDRLGIVVYYPRFTLYPWRARQSSSPMVYFLFD